MAVSSQQTFSTKTQPRSDRFKNSKYVGIGKLNMVLYPASMNYSSPRRKIWLINSPASKRQKRVPYQVTDCKSCLQQFGSVPDKCECRTQFFASELQEETKEDRKVNKEDLKVRFQDDDIPNTDSIISEDWTIPKKTNSDNPSPLDTLYRSNTAVYGGSIHRSKPVDLSLLNIIRPNFLPTTNANNNSNIVSEEKPEIPSNESNEIVAEKTNLNDTVMGVDTTTTRGGTLSQPCLTVSSSVGATQIFPHLYLGSQKDVIDENMMRSNGITYVLNVSKTCIRPEFIDDNHFHRISVRDNYQEKMTPHIKEAIEFIEKVRKSNQRVIVHCLAGVSRSATVAIAYVLHYLRITFEDAYRFVKEKRPSISPNFNFLGQLMEFEKSLKASGYLNSKRTGSLSESSDEDSQLTFNCLRACNTDTSKPGLRLNIFKAPGPECSPLIMPATCSFQCATQTTESTVRVPAVSTSSFCRRRNAPTFSKDAFASRCNNTQSSKCDTPMPKFNTAKTHFGKAGLRVSTARINEASRRLGSDGNEKDEMIMGKSDSYSPNGFRSTHTADVSVRIVEQTMDYTEDATSEDLSKPKTAPTTPIIGRQSCGRSSPWNPGQSAPVPKHRRCASGGGISAAEILQSPFNMKRRFEAARYERSASIGDVSFEEQSMDTDQIMGVKRGASFSGSYYDHSKPSPRSPHKFISMNSRSPKILRKNLHLNLRPMQYQNAPNRNGSKSETATTPVSGKLSVFDIDMSVPVFDCSHNYSVNKDHLKLNLNVCSDPEIKEAATPEAESDDGLVNLCQPLSLSSPKTEQQSGGLEFSSSSATLSSPATCPVLSSYATSEQMLSPGFICKASFTYTSSTKSKKVTNSQTRKPFTLSPPNDLKLKWRSKENRRQSADSGYLSSQGSSQSSSSFTSPISQPSIFVGDANTETFVNSTSDVQSPSPSSSCHLEGVYVNSDDVTNSKTDSDGRTNNVRQRNTVELMGCS